MELNRFFFYDSFRVGQKELASSIYDACVNGEQLAAEAVSGFGKTAAVLAGSLLAAEEKSLRIVYACRTKRQIFRVMEEVSNIQRHKELRAADLSSKYDYCLLMRTSPIEISSESFKWFCSFHTTNNLCSYFLNASLINHELMKLAKQKNSSFFPHTALLKRSEEIHVCPYEVARLAAGSADMIVTTYHYVFDETSRSVLFSNTELDFSKTIVILDEAHNLKHFIRNISSSTISFQDLDGALTESKQFYLESVQRTLATLSKRVKDACSASKAWHMDKDWFVDMLCAGFDRTWLSNLAFELVSFARVAWFSISARTTIPRSTLKLGKFLSNLLASVDAKDRFLLRSQDSLTLVSVDSARSFIDATKRFKSTILLSATLSPSQLFLRSIGLPDSTRVHRIESNPSLRITTLLDLGVTTKFKQRGATMYSKIASKIVAISLAEPGCIGVFTCSYTVLQALVPLIESSLPERNILVESRNMTNQRASEMMETFKSRRDSVLLAVQGGRFSEGEDFRGEQMNISIVVGLSLPPPTAELFAEYKYLGESDRENSYLLVSLLPALRKAFQSAGRHIRRPDKRGLVFLLDSRFDDSKIIGMMPSWLKQDMIKRDFSNPEITEIVRKFRSDAASS